MKITIVLVALIAMISVSHSAFASHLALEGRDLDGNPLTFEAVYDAVLDITWLVDANLAASNSFGVSGIDSVGRMNWNTAENFIAAMNADNGGAGYLGVSSWRQTTVSPVAGGSEFDFTRTYDGSSDTGFQISAQVDTFNPKGQSPDFTGAELAYQYFNNLAGIGRCSGVGGKASFGCVHNSVYGIDDATDIANLARFSNIRSGAYWTGQELSLELPSGPFIGAFGFRTTDGSQSLVREGSSLYVWAVASGDVATSAVPVPAAEWLFGSGLLAMTGIKRKVTMGK